jgi:glycosyltransferase 2 family protein
MTRTFRMMAGAAVSAGCLVFAFRSVPVHGLLTAITSVSYVIVLIWAVLASFSLLLRSARWRILLRATKPLPLGTVFAVNSAGQLGNAILPARLGDIFRATNLGSAGLSTGFTLATVFGERLLDTGFLVSISAMALTNFPELPAWLVRGSRLFAAIAAAGVAFALLIPRLERPLFQLVYWIAPERWAPRLNHLIHQFIDGLRSLRHPGRVSLFLLFTIVIWSLDGLGAVILARGLGVALSPALAILLLTAVALSSALPAAPGNIGVYQVVAVSVLAPFGVARPQALGLAILLQVLILTNLLIWGLGSLWFLSATRPQAAGVPAQA